MTNRRLIGLAVLTLLWGGIWLGGCTSREPYVGKYQSYGQPAEQQTIILELKPNGEGVWSAGDQRVTFRWEIKKEKIWRHTHGGGVLIGTPVGDEITVDMSGDLRPCCPVSSMVKFKRLPEGE
jgi:hypothetical protein